MSLIPASAHTSMTTGACRSFPPKPTDNTRLLEQSSIIKAAGTADQRSYPRPWQKSVPMYGLFAFHSTVFFQAIGATGPFPWPQGIRRTMELKMARPHTLLLKILLMVFLSAIERGRWAD